MIFDGELYAHKMSLNQISSACKKESGLDREAQLPASTTCTRSDPSPIGTRCYYEALALADSVLCEVETVKVTSSDDLMVCQREFIDQG